MSKSKFNVGDRVIIRGWDANVNGKVGTIRKIGQGGDELQVEFDEYINGHECDDCCKKGYGWYCPTNSATLISKCKFKVGDIIVGNERSDYKYSITNRENGFIGEVTNVTKMGDNESIKVKIIHTNHGYYVGDEFTVNSNYFDLKPTKELHITVEGSKTIGVYKNGSTTKKATAKCSPEDTFDFKTGARLVLERLGIVEEAHKYKAGDKVKIIANNCCHFGKIGDVVTLTHPCDVGAKQPSWSMEEQVGWIIESDIEPYVEPEKPKYYNGKVVCVKADTNHWTVGKIYEVKDGMVYSDKSVLHPRFGAPYANVDDIRHIGCIPCGDERHNPDNEFIPLVED